MVANTRNNRREDDPPAEEEPLEEEREESVLEISEILENYGVDVLADREKIEAKLFPVGIDGLASETKERLRDFFKDLRKIDEIDTDRRAIDVVVALMHMAKEMKNAGCVDTLQFTSFEQLDEYVEVVTERHAHDNPKVEYEVLKASDFKMSAKLQSQDDWEAWDMELKHQLKSLCNRDGKPSSYPLRDEDEPIVPEGQEFLLEGEDFPDILVNAAELKGVEWKHDNQLVRNIIAESIVNPSDAYTLAKTVLKGTDGRKIYKFLKSSYDNESVRKARITIAERDWENLQFKGAHHSKFETFMSQCMQNLADLETLKRPVHPAKAIEMLFDKVQCPTLEGYKQQVQLKYDDGEYGPASMDESKGFTPLKLLQKFAWQLQKSISKPKGFDRSIAAIGAGPGTKTTSVGPAPEEGPFTPDGDLFVGSYSKDQWFHSSMDAYRGQIMKFHKEQRSNKSKEKSKQSSGKQRKTVQKLKQQTKKLRQQLAEAGVDVNEDSSDGALDTSDDDTSSSSDDDDSSTTHESSGTNGKRKRRKND